MPPNKPRLPPEWSERSMLTPNMSTLTARRATVTGAWPPKNSERPLLHAAREKRRLCHIRGSDWSECRRARRTRGRVVGAFRRSRQTCCQRFASSARSAFANGREGPTVLLAGFRLHSYNTGNAPRNPAERTYGQIRRIRAETRRRNHTAAEISGRRSSAHNRKAHGTVSARSFRQAVGSGKEA